MSVSICGEWHPSKTIRCDRSPGHDGRHKHTDRDGYTTMWSETA